MSMNQELCIVASIYSHKFRIKYSMLKRHWSITVDPFAILQSQTCNELVYLQTYNPFLHSLVVDFGNIGLVKSLRRVIETGGYACVVLPVGIEVVPYFPQFPFTIPCVFGILEKHIICWEGAGKLYMLYEFLR